MQKCVGHRVGRIHLKEWIKNVRHHKLRRRAELLRSEGGLANASTLLLRGRVIDIQVAESKASATFDEMGPVHRSLETVANANSQNSGETVTGKGLQQLAKPA